MKRTPLRRKAPMKRRSGRPRKPPRKSKYTRRERDGDRMAWVSRQQCALHWTRIPRLLAIATIAALPLEVTAKMFSLPCERRIEVHHAGRHGHGQKSDDDTTIPLCDNHHDAITDRLRPFRDIPAEQVRVLQDALIAMYSELYEQFRLGLELSVDLY